MSEDQGDDKIVRIIDGKVYRERPSAPLGSGLKYSLSSLTPEERKKRRAKQLTEISRRSKQRNKEKGLTIDGTLRNPYVHIPLNENTPLKAREEAFALLYIQSRSVTESYMRVYAGHTKAAASRHRAVAAASRILGKPNVAKRIRELEEVARRKRETTVETIIDELEIARKAALSAGQVAAAVSATMGKAKVAGLIVDKQQIKQEVVHSVDQQSQVELARRIAFILERNKAQTIDAKKREALTLDPVGGKDD